MDMTIYLPDYLKLCFKNAHKNAMRLHMGILTEY